MLQNLHVKNLALIDECEVEFSDGLNILSGETGAGKSIIIGSINLALGEKVQKEMLRDNEKPAFVELIFSVEDPKIIEALRELDVEVEDGCVILSRKITQSRAVGRVNGEAVSVSRMKEIASYLIDIHGQHEHQSLLSKKKHLDILDEYAKQSLGDKKQQLSSTSPNISDSFLGPSHSFVPRYTVIVITGISLSSFVNPERNSSEVAISFSLRCFLAVSFT